jgi:hypothetical protein
MEIMNSLLNIFELEAKDLRHPKARSIEKYSEIKPGDHVAVLRRGASVYWHHGICIGHENMIDFSGDDKTQAIIDKRSFMKFFKDDHAVVVIDYPENESYSVGETICLAHELLNHPIKYHSLLANCECVATLCRCGRYVKNLVAFPQVSMYPSSFK